MGHKIIWSGQLVAGNERCLINITSSSYSSVSAGNTLPADAYFEDFSTSNHATYHPFKFTHNAFQEIEASDFNTSQRNVLPRLKLAAYLATDTIDWLWLNQSYQIVLENEEEAGSFYIIHQALLESSNVAVAEMTLNQHLQPVIVSTHINKLMLWTLHENSVELLPETNNTIHQTDNLYGRLLSLQDIIHDATPVWKPAL